MVPEKEARKVAELKKRHIYILLLALLCAAYHLLAGQKALMKCIGLAALRARKAICRVCAALPFSVCELICTLGVLALLGWLLWLLISLLRNRGRRLKTLWRRISFLLAVLLTIYFLLCLSLGSSYHLDGFQVQSGLRAQPSSTKDLYEVTAFFTRELAKASESVPREEDGSFAVPLDTLLDEAPEIYRGVEAQYPFLTLRDCRPKALFFSRLVSRINFTGFYFPFTGEANLNVDIPLCMIPSTAAHEMAHQRGLSSEQEANFVAILACLESGSDAYVYGGLLFGFIHLGNALWRHDADSYYALLGQLPEAVLQDIRDNNAYWAQFETKVAQVTEKVYDGMLKSYGLSSGVQSYGEVVDLLIAWYAAREAL